MIFNAFLLLAALSFTTTSGLPKVPPVVTALPPRSSRAGDDSDNSASGSDFLGSLISLKQGTVGNAFSSSSSDIEDLLNNYPFEEPRDTLYGTLNVPPVPPQPAFGVAINTHGLLAPHAEVLRLVEAFLRLKGEIVSRLYALYNDNYDLIRAVTNLVIKKLSSLHAFSLKGVAVLRKILEFALNVFSDWNFTLPSVTIGASSAGGYAQQGPHEVYGVPDLEANNFFNNK